MMQNFGMASRILTFYRKRNATDSYVPVVCFFHRLASFFCCWCCYVIFLFALTFVLCVAALLDDVLYPSLTYLDLNLSFLLPYIRWMKEQCVCWSRSTRTTRSCSEMCLLAALCLASTTICSLRLWLDSVLLLTTSSSPEGLSPSCCCCCCCCWLALLSILLLLLTGICFAACWLIPLFLYLLLSASVVLWLTEFVVLCCAFVFVCRVNKVTKRIEWTMREMPPVYLVGQEQPKQFVMHPAQETNNIKAFYRYRMDYFLRRRMLPLVCHVIHSLTRSLFCGWFDLLSVCVCVILDCPCISWRVDQKRVYGPVKPMESANQSGNTLRHFRARLSSRRRPT